MSHRTLSKPKKDFDVDLSALAPLQLATTQALEKCLQMDEAPARLNAELKALREEHAKDRDALSLMNVKAISGQASDEDTATLRALVRQKADRIDELEATIGSIPVARETARQALADRTTELLDAAYSLLTPVRERAGHAVTELAGKLRDQVAIAAAASLETTSRRVQVLVGLLPIEGIGETPPSPESVQFDEALEPLRWLIRRAEQRVYRR